MPAVPPKVNWSFQFSMKIRSLFNTLWETLCTKTHWKKLSFFCLTFEPWKSWAESNYLEISTRGRTWWMRPIFRFLTGYGASVRRSICWGVERSTLLFRSCSKLWKLKSVDLTPSTLKLYKLEPYKVKI